MRTRVRTRVRTEAGVRSELEANCSQGVRRQEDAQAMKGQALMKRCEQTNGLRAHPPDPPACAGLKARARAGKCVCVEFVRRCHFSRHIEWFLPGRNLAETRAGTVAVGHRVSFGCPVFRTGDDNA